MVAAVPIVGAIAGGLTSSALGGGIMGALAGFAVSTAINSIGKSVFQKKPSSASFSAQAEGISTLIRSSVDTHKIIYGRTRISGPLPYFDITGADNKYLHFVVPLAGHEIEEIETVYLDNVALTLDGNGFVTNEPYYKNGVPYIRVKKHLGTASQTVDPDLLAETSATEAYTYSGISYIYIRFEYNADIFPLGIPNPSAIIKGKKLYDPRTSLTAYSDNAALAIRDYLTSDYGWNLDESRIDDDYFISAANACEEQIELVDGSFQDRYTANGFLDTKDSLQYNLNQLVGSLMGAVTYVQGKYRCFAGVYETPAFSIDEDDIMGEGSIRVRASRKELFNAVKGVFRDPAKDFQLTDFPIVTNSTYETQDGGERIEKDIELQFCDGSERAQRLAKIGIEKSRQGIIYTIPVSYKALEFSVWDNIYVTNSQIGWTNKVFKLINWEFRLGEPISLVLQEESSASYDWDKGEATIIDPAPDSSLPDPFNINPPGAPSVTEEKYITTNGSGVKVRANVTWEPAQEAFIDYYQLEYKLTSASNYKVLPQISDTNFTIDDIAPGTYNIRVKAVSTFLTSSEYATGIFTIIGLQDTPEDINNFSVISVSNNAFLSWDQATDLDVLVGGKVKVRYTPDISTPNWTDAVDVGIALPGITTHAITALVPGTYMAKFIDSVGNESANAAFQTVENVSVINMNLVATSTQQTAFSGTKTNMTAVDNVLRLDGAVLFDDIAGNFDDQEGAFDYGGGAGQVLSGSYEFDNYLDIGAVQDCYILMNIKVDIYDGVDLFDFKTGLFDSQKGLFDGDDVTGIDVKLFIRYTNDDPSGSPTWSNWQLFFAGDFKARAFEFKIEVSSINSSLQIDIEQLGAKIYTPDITESGVVTLSSGTTTTINFDKTYFAIPDVAVIINNIASGDTLDFVPSTDITTSNFTVGVLNSAAYVARSITYIVRGH